jgi:hypothetical protein
MRLIIKIFLCIFALSVLSITARAQTTEKAQPLDKCEYLDGKIICEDQISLREKGKLGCIKTPSGSVKCGTIVIQRTALATFSESVASARITCVMDGDGQLWCGDDVAEFSFPNLRFVCVTDPCPTGTVKLKDIVGGMEIQMKSQVELFVQSP